MSSKGISDICLTRLIIKSLLFFLQKNFFPAVINEENDRDMERIIRFKKKKGGGEKGGRGWEVIKDKNPSKCSCDKKTSLQFSLERGCDNSEKLFSTRENIAMEWWSSLAGGIVKRPASITAKCGVSADCVYPAASLPKQISDTAMTRWWVTVGVIDGVACQHLGLGAVDCRCWVV